MDPSVLLTLMFATYTVPIVFVYLKYHESDTGSRSISSIITSKEPFITLCEQQCPPPSIRIYNVQQETSSLRVWS